MNEAPAQCNNSRLGISTIPLEKAVALTNVALSKVLCAGLPKSPEGIIKLGKDENIVHLQTIAPAIWRPGYMRVCPVRYTLF